MKKWNKMVILIGALIVISLLATVLVVISLCKRPTSGEAEKPADVTQFFENAYIISCKEDSMELLYDGEVHSFTANLDAPYEGIADVHVTNDVVDSVVAKENYISGTILAFREDEVKIEGYDCCRPPVSPP